MSTIQRAFVADDDFAFVVVGILEVGLPSFVSEEHHFHWNRQVKNYVMSYNLTFQSCCEVDAWAMIVEVMEAMGWHFKFQFESQIWSENIINDDTATLIELFVFQKDAVKYEVVKKSVDSKVGIALSTAGSFMFVKKVTDGGLFDQTGIKEGYKVLSVNGIPCKGKSADEAVSIITESDGKVSILAFGTDRKIIS